LQVYSSATLCNRDVLVLYLLLAILLAMAEDSKPERESHTVTHFYEGFTLLWREFLCRAEIQQAFKKHELGHIGAISSVRFRSPVNIGDFAVRVNWM